MNLSGDPEDQQQAFGPGIWLSRVAACTGGSRVMDVTRYTREVLRRFEPAGNVKAKSIGKTVVMEDLMLIIENFNFFNICPKVIY